MSKAGDDNDDDDVCWRLDRFTLQIGCCWLQCGEQKEQSKAGTGELARMLSSSEVVAAWTSVSA